MPIEESTRDTLKTSPRIKLEQDPTAGPYENATMKEPSGDMISSLNVVCYPCLCQLSYWRCINSTGSCREPSHDKVLLFGLVIGGLKTFIGCCLHMCHFSCNSDVLCVVQRLPLSRSESQI